MGQKANIMSLRKPFNLLYKGNTFLSEKQYIKSFIFLKHLTQSFKRKNFLITEVNFNTQPQINYFTFRIYIQYKGIKRMPKRVSVRKFKNKKYVKKKDFFKNNSKLNLLFNKSIWNSFNTNLTILKFKFWNKNTINKKDKRKLTRFFRYSDIIFKRKYAMYKDLMGLSCLFIKHLISAEIYNNLLTLLFSRQSKKSQSQYFKFLRRLVPKLIYFPNSQIQGMRVLINGRLQGKLRANSLLISCGKIGNQTLSKNVEYTKATAYTITGTYGVHLWVNFKKHEDFYMDK